MEKDFIMHYDDNNPEFGFAHIMYKGGVGYAELYWFSSDITTFYLRSLSVDVSERNKGIGLQLQLVREKMASDRGGKYTMLWVKKGTWMRKWYARRGYEYYSKRSDDSTTVWLRKKL